MITRTLQPHSRSEQTPPLDFLLAEERAAAETYAHALARFVLPRHSEALHRLLAEHERAARHLSEYARADGPATPGTWQRLPRVVDAGARFHIREAVLWALRAAEERSVHDYEECLSLDEIPDACKGLIRSALLPATREHLYLLDEVIQVAAEEIELA